MIPHTARPNRAIKSSGGRLACRRAGHPAWRKKGQQREMPKGMKFERLFPGGETRALYGWRDTRRYFLCPTLSIASHSDFGFELWDAVI